MGIRLLFLQVQVGIAVLIILLMRVGMRKLPRIYFYMLWLLVFARLLFPVSFETRFGFMPSAAGGRLWLEEQFGRTDTAVGRQSVDSMGTVSIDGEAYAAEGAMEAGSDIDTDPMTESAAGAASLPGSGQLSEKAAGTEINGNGIYGSEGVPGVDSNADIGETQPLISGDQAGNYNTSESVRYSDSISGNFTKISNSGSDSDVYLQPEGADTAEPHGNWQLSVLWRNMLLILWAVVAAAILTYNGYALTLVKKKIKGAEHFKDNIYICSYVRVPFTLGMLCPKIYLPANLSEKEREYIICHEKIHIRRKDYIVKSIAFLLTALNWFNPFVWVAFYFMEKDMEMSCDEKVIRKMGEEIKKQYSQSLLDFAEGKCSAAVTPITFGEKSVKQRVSHVLSYKAASKGAAVLGTMVILVSAAMMFTVRSDAQGQTGERRNGNQQSEEQQSGNWQYNRRQNPGQQEKGTASGTDSNTQISPEGGSSVIRDIGASAELISLSVTLAQKSPYSALECWARAFTDRNGDVLFRLAADGESFKKWEMVSQGSSGSFSFGESSPWPWDYDYEITVPGEESGAEITFYMRTSVPEIYLLRETVSITELGGLYYVDHRSTWDNYSIGTAQEYREAYGGETVSHRSDAGGHGESDIYAEGGNHAEGNIYTEDSVYSRMAALYDDSFYRAVLTQLLEGSDKDFYRRFTDPVSAAEELLHLGEGSGEVTERDMIPITGLKSEDAIHQGWNTVEPPDWINALSVAGEGSRVTVSYTFARDGSRVEIPMELKEGSQGIWGLAGGGIRDIYKWISGPEMTEHEEGKEDLSYVIELSSYGIYRFGAHSGLTCLWPGDVGPEAAAWVYEDKLYIFESLERARINSDDGAEVVFVLELLTGELHREHLAIPQNYEHLFPRVSFGVGGGYVYIYGFGSIVYSLPLENLNETIWNHKTFRQMSEEDKQSYGVENRDYLLSNPDTLVRLSIREPEQTLAYIDLDGDGVSEQIILSTEPSDRRQYGGHDGYQLRVKESVITGWSRRLHNDIWAYSPDGEQIILALYEEGPSDDPCTYLFGYENGELSALGEFPQDIRACTMEDGTIRGMMRCDVIQTDSIQAGWRIGASGKVELVPQEVFDFVLLNNIELLEELPVQNVLPASEDGIFFGINHFTISPQTVRFLQTDSTFSWVCVEAADGSRGWFRMDGHTVEELGKDSSEVFHNLFLAD